MPLDDYGPPYPDLGSTVARLRHGPDRKAHGLAVLEAIRRLQRSSLMSESRSHTPHCASMTAHTNGKKILRAVADRQRAALLAYPSQVRRKRTDAEWQKLYAAAMAEKRRAYQPTERAA